MNFRMFFGVGVKSLGLFFVLALNLYHSEDANLPKFYLIWGYVTFISSSFCISYAQFIVSSRCPKSFVVCKAIPIVLIVCALSLALFQPWYALFITLLGVFFLNISTDTFLLWSGKSVLYLALAALKNIFALLAILFGSELQGVLVWYLFGEVVKYFCYILIFMNKDCYESSGSFKMVGFVRYSTYIMVLSALVVVDRTIVFLVSPSLVIDFELFYRAIESAVTACSAWTVPAYIFAMNRKDAKSLRHFRASSIKFSWLCVLVAVFLVLFCVFLKLEIPFNYRLSGVSLYLTIFFSVLLLPMMVEALFIRRQMGLLLNAKDYLPYFKLFMIKFLLIGILLVALGGDHVVYSIFLATMLMLICENIYIKRTLLARGVYGF